MSEYSHLSDVAKQVIKLSDKERIEHILKDRWVGYDKANDIITKLDDLLAHPKVERMPNMLIVGDSNNGKTRLVNHFFSKNPPDENPLGSTIKVPVLLVEAPSDGDLPHLHKIILDMLISPYKKNTKDDDLEEQVIKILKGIELGIIIIDEIHNLLNGSPKEQRIFLAGLKTLGNRVKVPIVGVGTEDAFRGLQTDSQLSNRFAVERLHKWKIDINFLRFLASMESILPLRDPSNLSSKDIATKIYALSEGLIGEISTLLNKAAQFVIRNTKPGQPERITIDVLNSCGYVPPSLRTGYKRS